MVRGTGRGLSLGLNPTSTPWTKWANGFAPLDLRLSPAEQGVNGTTPSSSLRTGQLIYVRCVISMLAQLCYSGPPLPLVCSSIPVLELQGLTLQQDGAGNVSSLSQNNLNPETLVKATERPTRSFQSPPQ